jgi:hypothetical protein
VKPTDTRADFPAPCASRPTPCAASARPEIVVVSDGALGEPTDAAGPVHLGDMKLSYVARRQRAKNAAITAFSVRRYPLDKSRYEVMLEVTNTGARADGHRALAPRRRQLVDLTRLRLKPRTRSSPASTRTSPAPAARSRPSSLRRRIERRAPRRRPRLRALARARRARVQVVTAWATCTWRPRCSSTSTSTSPPSRRPATQGRRATSTSPSSTACHRRSAPGERRPALPEPTRDNRPSPSRSTRTTPNKLGFDELDAKHPLVRYTALDDVNIAARPQARPRRRTRSSGESDQGPAPRQGAAPARSSSRSASTSARAICRSASLAALAAQHHQRLRRGGRRSYISSFRTGDVWNVPRRLRPTPPRWTLPRRQAKREVPVKDGRAVFLGQNAGFYSVSTGAGRRGDDRCSPRTCRRGREHASPPVPELNVDGKRARPGERLQDRRAARDVDLPAHRGVIVTAIEWAHVPPEGDRMSARTDKVADPRVDRGLRARHAGHPLLGSTALRALHPDPDALVDPQRRRPTSCSPKMLGVGAARALVPHRRWAEPRRSPAGPSASSRCVLLRAPSSRCWGSASRGSRAPPRPRRCARCTSSTCPTRCRTRPSRTRAPMIDAGLDKEKPKDDLVRSSPSRGGLAWSARRGDARRPPLVERHMSTPRASAASSARAPTSRRPAARLRPLSPGLPQARRAALRRRPDRRRLLAEANRAKDFGIKLFTVPVPPARPRPRWPCASCACPTVKVGETFEVHADIYASRATTAKAALPGRGLNGLDGVRPRSQGRRTTSCSRAWCASPGRSPTSSSCRDGRGQVQGEQPGRHHHRRAWAPAVLYIEGTPQHASPLQRPHRPAARRRRAPPAGFPRLAEGARALRLRHLSDTPREAVSLQAQELIESYVRDLGGGFLFAGGESGYGLGGWYHTTIERILPVRMDNERKKEMPSVAMCLVIDRSGSMTGLPLEMAKAAAKATGTRSRPTIWSRSSRSTRSRRAT